MFRIMCKSKIHGAVVTSKNLYYEGSITIDRKLMKVADILPNEIVQIVNLENGERFETYVISGKANSGVIALNGAAARLGEPGDKIIIISSIIMNENEKEKRKTIVVKVNEKNRISKVRYVK